MELDGETHPTHTASSSHLDSNPFRPHPTPARLCRIFPKLRSIHFCRNSIKATIRGEDAASSTVEQKLSGAETETSETLTRAGKFRYHFKRDELMREVSRSEKCIGKARIRNAEIKKKEYPTT
ncbi:hypothetical protein EVAR_51097_1 [Eumeta japonica]|uniref:Uncharacterized protein n=1 Tax=Eumeta variegata TaxID=151549 RepID=A0A4C1XPB5_EUMVA|nr:hypothetical protein EVAR_51097_1 [Eumeta japonica]